MASISPTISTKVFTTHVVLSVISVLACTLAMFASSYAWFSTEVSSEFNIIEAAHYDIDVKCESVTRMADNGEWVEVLSAEEDDGEWTTHLASGDRHKFVLTATGSAKEGYCKIIIDNDEVYYTEQIAQGTNMTVYITATRGVDITFQPVWGNLEDHDWQEWDELTRYGDGKDIPEAATFFLLAAFDEEETEDEAEPEDYIPGPTTPGLEVMMPQYGTLEGIAEHYSCSLIDILIYNELDFEDELEPGDELFLPYADEEAGDYEPTPPDIEHEVLEGETIESIAELYDISIEELIEYNELEPVEIEEEKPEEEPGAVEPGVPMEQPEWMEEQEEIEEIEEPEEPDINELYPLTPGDIILIPFEAASGYTPSDAVYEEDLPAVEPGTGEFVVIEPDSVLNSGSDEEQAQPDEEEEQPSYEEQLPQEEQQSSGILSVGGSLSPEQEENETTDEQQSDVSTEEEQPQQGGILSAGS